MNKREKNNVVWAAVAIIAVCLIMAFASGCKPKLEVGQVWEDGPYGDPFKTWTPAMYKIVALEYSNSPRKLYVQYERIDEHATGVIGSMREGVFRANDAKLVSGLFESDGIDITVPGVIEVEDEANLIKIDEGLTATTGEPLTAEIAKEPVKPIEGHLRWISKTKEHKAYLEIYDGKGWVVVEYKKPYLHKNSDNDHWICSKHGDLIRYYESECSAGEYFFRTISFFGGAEYCQDCVGEVINNNLSQYITGVKE